MAGIREIRRRIRVVKNIQQITKAMKMVAVAKLKVAQNRVLATDPYAKKMESVMNHLLESLGNLEDETKKIKHPFITPKETEKTVGLVIITSDRGLCGSFNTNVLRKAQESIKNLSPAKVKIITIGRRGHDYLKKRDFEIIGHYTKLSPSTSFNDIKKISERIKELYLSGELDAVYFCYTHFITMMNVKPVLMKFLPLSVNKEISDSSDNVKYSVKYIMEPEPVKLLNDFLPKYVDMKVYQIILESFTSEFAARMSAMTLASDNAEELKKALTITYNKIRQTSITKELLDIVGGAEALK